MSKRLLLNWVYYLPAGHVVEAIQHAHGYHAANPDLSISLLLNADAGKALGLAEGCPWLAGVYSVSLAELGAQGQEAPSLRAVPQTWDYVVHDPRVLPGRMKPGWDEEELMAAQPVIQAYLRATIWSGASPGFDVRWDTEGLLATDTPLPFKPNVHLQLQVPAEARTFAERYAHNGPTIAILPVSTAGLGQSPSPRAWGEVCAAFAEAFPGVRMYITGITYVNDRGEREGFDFGPGDAHAIAKHVPGVEECFDIGMWNQLALIERCDLFCSPHTGFAFLAPYVGTPWLTISGCPWPEYHFNGLPFYSALPECPNYPGSAHPDSECMRRWNECRQPDCMADKAIRRRIPDIMAGAQLLLEQRLSFPEACRLHIDKLAAAGYDVAQFGYFAGPAGD
jgi:hypothetical protein